MTSLDKAIGGYFELELPKNQGCLYPNALRYQSARAAFYALLLCVKPQRVWVPYYICDSMLSPLYKENIEINFYSLNYDLSILDDFELKENDLLLYVNYFGVCSDIQDAVLGKYNNSQVVFDHSQAFFQAPKNCLATIYSPRKFFGVPDGGLLVTSLRIKKPLGIDTESVNRVGHLIKRLAGEPEKGYLDFKKNEDNFNKFEPKRMSILTEKILNSIDYENIKQKRNNNFKYLSQRLKASNQLKINNESIDGPMGYPYLVDRIELKEKLISSRVFIPTYWPEVLGRKNISSNEVKLVNDLNLIPCDQRYNDIDLEFVCEKILMKTV